MTDKAKNRETEKIRQNFLQQIDGETPSAPIGLLLQREVGWGGGGRLGLRD